MLEKKPTKRDLQSKQKSDLIFQTAMDLFREYGFKQTTVQDISRATGMSVGSIYHFYKDKYGILRRLFLEINDKMKDQLPQNESSLADPARVILDYYSQGVDQLLYYGSEIIREMNKALTMDDQAMQQRNWLRTVDDVACFIRFAKEHGRLVSDVQPEDASHFLYTLSSGILYFWMFELKDLDLSEEYQKQITFALQAIFPNSIVMQHVGI